MLWKFNNLLLSDNISKEKLKQHIQNIENDNELSKASTIAQKKCTCPCMCSRTRRDTNEKEHSKSKDKEN